MFSSTIFHTDLKNGFHFSRKKHKAETNATECQCNEFVQCDRCCMAHIGKEWSNEIFHYDYW